MKTKTVYYARKMFAEIGVDLSDPNYKETPERFVKWVEDFTSSLRKENDQEIKDSLNKCFPKHNGQSFHYKGMLVQTPIRIYSLCSHHLLPVVYDISFAYIPKNNKQVGFSKTARALKLLAKRPMNQEDFTQNIVEVFDKFLEPKGLMVVVEGIHFCMKMRGVESDAKNITSAVKGEFKKYAKTREEFLKHVRS